MESWSSSYDPLHRPAPRATALPVYAGAYNADDEISSETYDANGNVIATGGKTYTYDSQNHMITANNGQVTMIYDGDGNRVSKTVGGVTTQYLVDDLNPTGYAQVVEEVVNGAVTRQYTYGLQRISQNLSPAVSGNSTWTPSFYVYDGGGSVRQLTNSNGTVTDEYEYDAYGNSFTKSGTTPNNYLYRGEQYDSRLRPLLSPRQILQPHTGGSSAAIPQDGAPTDPATLHKYDYAGSDPVNAMDPTGRSSMVEFLLPIVTIDLGPNTTQTLYDKYTHQYVTTSAPRTILALKNLACAVKALYAQGSFTAQGILSDADFVECTAWPDLAPNKGTNMFTIPGTNWCGPGGGGTPTTRVDAACKAHDRCYDRVGVSWKNNVGLATTTPQQRRINACDAALSNAIRNISWPTSAEMGQATIVSTWFNLPSDTA